MGKLISALNSVIDPVHGKFEVKNIETSLSDVFGTYENIISVLQKLSNEGLSEEDIKNFDSDQYAMLSRVISSVTAVLPGIGIGQEVEMPIGPGLSVYYSVEGKTDSSASVNLIIEEQKLQLKDFNYSAEGANGLKLETEMDPEGGGSLSVGSPNSEVKINLDGSLETGGTVTIGDSAYTVKLIWGVHEFSYEESVTTQIGDGEIKSTIGIKKTDGDHGNGWVPVPVPVPVYEPETVPVVIPQISAPKVDWEDAAITITAVCIVTGLVLAVPTGGSSLVLCGV